MPTAEHADVYRRSRRRARPAGRAGRYMVARNSGEVTDAVSSTVPSAFAFMPVGRAQGQGGFRPPISSSAAWCVRFRQVGTRGPSTPAAWSSIRANFLDDLRRRCSLEEAAASVSPATSIDEAMDMLRAGTADAFALTHDSLAPARGWPARFAHSRWRLRRTGIAVAVAEKNRPAVLAYVSDFVGRQGVRPRPPRPRCADFPTQRWRHLQAAEAARRHSRQQRAGAVPQLAGSACSAGMARAIPALWPAQACMRSPVARLAGGLAHRGRQSPLDRIGRRRPAHPARLRRA